MMSEKEIHILTEEKETSCTYNQYVYMRREDERLLELDYDV